MALPNERIVLTVVCGACYRKRRMGRLPLGQTAAQREEFADSRASRLESWGARAQSTGVLHVGHDHHWFDAAERRAILGSAGR